MKTRLTALLLIVSLLMFAGCAASTAETGNEPVKETTPETTVVEDTTTQSDAQAETQPESDTSDKTTDPANTGLSEDDALAVALTDAGLTKDDIVNWWAEYEVDDGVPEYEVEFYTDTTEYDYTIHAETGVILDRDQETEHLSPTAAATAQLTEDDVITIALTAAELTEADVTNLHVEYDAEDGHYDVEFHYSNQEYAYEIHAATGDIYEREIDHD